MGLLLGMSVVLLCWAPAAARAEDRATVIQKLLVDNRLADAAREAKTLLDELAAAGKADALPTADALDLLARASLGRGNSEKVREYTSKAEAIRDRILGRGNAANGASERILADQLVRAGEPVQALAAADRALKMERDAAPPASSLEIAETLSVRGNALRLSGKPDDARRDWAESLAIRERELPADDVAVGRAAFNLALLSAGEEGRRLAERAVAAFTKHLGPEHYYTGVALHRQGLILEMAADFTAARPVYERAAAVAAKNPAMGAAVTGDIGRRLGFVLGQLGDFAEAERVLQRTAMVDHEAKNFAGLVDTYSRLSGIQIELGNFGAAKDTALKGVALAAERFGKDTSRTADALEALGMAYEALKDWDNNEKTSAEELRIRRLLNDGSERMSNALANVSSGAVRRGDYAEASRLMREAIALYAKTAPLSRAVAELTASEGRSEGHLGHRDRAFAAGMESERVRRELMRVQVASLPERQAILSVTPRRQRPTGLDLLLTLASDRTGLNAEQGAAVWTELMRERGTVLDELGKRHRAIHDLEDAEGEKLAERLSGARLELARFAVRREGQGAPEAEAAKRGLEDAERAVAERSHKLKREFQDSDAGYAELSRALPGDSVLVAYARYLQIAFGLPGDKYEPSYMAWVLRAGSEPVAVHLGKSSDIDALVARWRAEIDKEAAAAGRNAKQNEASYIAAAGALRRKVWDPLERRFARASRVFIVADGALLGVNFDTLPGAGGRYLAESEPLLHTLGTERDLLRGPQAARGHGLLAVGNPAYQSKQLSTVQSAKAVYRGHVSSCSDFARIRFEPLPASGDEVAAIRQTWPGGDTAALTGGRATEAAVKEMAHGKRVIHLATHGFFLGQCGDNAVLNENPLLRSGLALAGANLRARAGAGQEDGILTAEEIAALDLDGTEWVVLSGCDTGAGEVKAREGVLGLPRAFQIAGARTVIMSLWPVEDEEARRWMTALYRVRFRRGLDTATAVRSADREILAERRKAGLGTHPFHWAGFTAIGDWR